MSTCKDRLLYKDEFGDIHTVDKINGKRIGDKAVKSKLFDYEQEEADGKLIHLPCKVGDTVYYFFNDNLSEYCEVSVAGFHIDKYRIAFEIEVSGCKFFVDTEFLGEKVFPTKEEAEKALKERNNNDT